MVATVTEIARRAKVSKGLVSRLLNKDQSLRISTDRKDYILSVKKSLDISSNANDSGVKRKIAYNFVIPCNCKEVLDELYAHMSNPAYQSLKSLLKAHGFRLNIVFFQEEESGENFKELIYSEGYCDAIILDGGIANKEIAEMLLANKFPHICLRWQGEVLGLNTVFEDYAIGIHQAVARLVELGHTKIGYLGHHHHTYPNYMSAMFRSGLKVNEQWCCTSPMEGSPVPETMEGWRSAAKEAFSKWLKAGNEATAMICHNDYGAAGAIDALAEYGLTPGKDMSIFGSGNYEAKGLIRFSEEPFIATMDSNMERLGTRLGERLLNQVLYNQVGIVHERLPVKFLERRSIGSCSR
jgi:DNA-binding LacI/PurR family transcriptional regulator